MMIKYKLKVTSAYVRVRAHHSKTQHNPRLQELDPSTLSLPFSTLPLSNVLPNPYQEYPKPTDTYIGGGKRALSTWSLLKAFINTVELKDEAPTSLIVSLSKLSSVLSLITNSSSVLLSPISFNTSVSLDRCNRIPIQNLFLSNPD